MMMIVENISWNYFCLKCNKLWEINKTIYPFGFYRSMSVLIILGWNRCHAKCKKQRNIDYKDSTQWIPILCIKYQTGENMDSISHQNVRENNRRKQNRCLNSSWGIVFNSSVRSYYLLKFYTMNSPGAFKPIWDWCLILTSRDSLLVFI